MDCGSAVLLISFNVEKIGLRFLGKPCSAAFMGSTPSFPSSTGPLGAASSFAMMFGGGVDLQVAKHLRVRAVEADYVRSTLPNNADNAQNDLRLAAGVSFHFSGVR